MCSCFGPTWGLFWGASLVVFYSLTHSATAQSPLPGVPPSAPGTVEQTIPGPNQPSPPPEPLPPEPAPSLQIPPPLPSPVPVVPAGERFLIRRIVVLGSTVLQDEITALTRPLENQAVTFAQLIQLRAAITQLYVERGYVTSGAFLLSNQNLSDGVVQIQVVEGELERVDISGLTHLQEGYIRSRIGLAATRPLSRQRLEEGLRLLQLDPVIAQVNAELTVGSTPGRSILRMVIRETPPFHAQFLVENRQSPSVGSLSAGVLLNHDNLFGFGDRLSAAYELTEGLDSYDLSYTVPVNPRDGTVSLRYSNSDSDVVEAPFQRLGIRSETRTLSLGLRQPLLKTPEREFALSLALDLRRSQTFLLDQPFPFTEGPDDEGISKVTVLRFSQDWLDRRATRVLAARSQFSLGLDALDATNNRDGAPDGQFFAWLGQFQWVQQLPLRAILLARINAQLTPNSLLSLERLSLGGVDTVRGYRQNQLVSDNGILGSLEVRFPLTRDPRILQVSPFVEFGKAWNNQRLDPDPSLIASVGLSLRWLITNGLSVQLDYGAPLISIDNRGDSLQDKGFYFSIRYQPF